MHVNFANVDELNEYHKKFYLDTSEEEYSKLMDKLFEFEDQIAPVAKDIRDLLDNSYTDDLQKKGALPSLMTNLGQAAGTVAVNCRRRLAGGEGR